MNQTITRCSEILRQELGLIPEVSKYDIHSSKQWPEFCARTNTNNQVLRTYFPRTLSAHIRDDSEFKKYGIDNK